MMGSPDTGVWSQTLDGEPYQLAIWLMDEHVGKPCSESCPAATLFGQPLGIERIATAEKAGIKHMIDTIRGDMLGRLCGQFEPHGNFITCDHEYVIIDNECMFAEEPSLNQCRWILDNEARPVVEQVCRDFLGVSEKELLDLAILPARYKVEGDRDLKRNVLTARAAAREDFS